MKPQRLAKSLLAHGIALTLISCDKGDENATGGSNAQTEGASETSAPGALSYRESVRVSMGPLEMEIPLPDDDPIKGRITMSRALIADVKHPTARQKSTHIRRLISQKTGEIFGHDVPRQTTGDPSALTGREIFADLTGEGWVYRLRNPEADEAVQDDLEELNQVSRGEALFYQGHKLEPGESWNVPLEALSRWFGKDAIALAGDISVKVDRLETIDNEPFAILDVSMDIQGKLRDEDGKTLDMKTRAGGTISRSTTRSFDRSVQLTGDVDFYAEVPEQNTHMTMKGPLEITESRVEF